MITLSTICLDVINPQILVFLLKWYRKKKEI